jgi:repressor LexA
MLTRKQRELLDFIIAFQKQNGWSPSYSEMADAMGLASRSGIHRMIEALMQRGYIAHVKNRNRGIEVLVKDGVKVPPPRTTAPALHELKQEYFCQAGAIAMPETIAVPLMTSKEMSAAIAAMIDSGEPYKVSVIVRLQGLGGQG